MMRLRRSFSISASYLLCVGSLCESTLAQQGPCPLAEVEVNVILPDGRLIRGLKSDNLVAQVKHDKLKIDSISYDTGPRRILFVLDTGRDLPRDAKRAEAEVISYVISQAPVDNSFALITARGVTLEVRFGEPREKLAAALKQVSEPAKGEPGEQGVLDAVMGAIEWFEKPVPGDAIVLMASEIENNKHAKYSTVAKTLAENHIRVFSVLLGPMLAGTVYSDIGIDFRGHLSSSSIPVPNRENLSALTWNSGGYMMVENTKVPWKEYKLTDAHLDELRHEGWQMYGAMAEFYRVFVVPPQSDHHEEWSLELAESIRKRVPQAKVLYPRELPACMALRDHP
jgi:hypothetical protein